jgi:hypothetical protein
MQHVNLISALIDEANRPSCRERMIKGLDALGYGLSVLADGIGDPAGREQAEDDAQRFNRRLAVVAAGDGRDEALAAGLRLALGALGLTASEAVRLLGLREEARS